MDCGFRVAFYMCPFVSFPCLVLSTFVSSKRKRRRCIHADVCARTHSRAHRIGENAEDQFPGPIPFFSSSFFLSTSVSLFDPRQNAGTSTRDGLIERSGNRFPILFRGEVLVLGFLSPPAQLRVSFFSRVPHFYDEISQHISSLFPSPRVNVAGR